MTLDQDVEKEFAKARKYAEQGDASSMGNLLSLAQRYAAKAGQDISAQVTQIRALAKK